MEMRLNKNNTLVTIALLIVYSVLFSNCGIKSMALGEVSSKKISSPIKNLQIIFFNSSDLSDYNKKVERGLYEQFKKYSQSNILIEGIEINEGDNDLRIAKSDNSINDKAILKLQEIESGLKYIMYFKPISTTRRSYFYITYDVIIYDLTTRSKIWRAKPMFNLTTRGGIKMTAKYFVKQLRSNKMILKKE